MKAKGLIAASFVAIVGILAYNIYSRVNDKATIVSATAELPDFQFRSLNGEQLTRRDVDGKPVLLTFFLTDCEFCQMEIGNMLALKDFTKMNTWLISPEKDSVLKAFAKERGLLTLPNIKIARDTSNLGGRIFGISTTPTSFLYSGDGHLVKRYNGAIRPEIVLKDISAQR